MGLSLKASKTGHLKFGKQRVKLSKKEGAVTINTMSKGVLGQEVIPELNSQQIYGYNLTFT